jgi:hypothetical protein
LLQVDVDVSSREDTIGMGTDPDSNDVNEHALLLHDEDEKEHSEVDDDSEDNEDVLLTNEEDEWDHFDPDDDSENKDEDEGDE